MGWHTGRALALKVCDLGSILGNGGRDFFIVTIIYITNAAQVGTLHLNGAPSKVQMQERAINILKWKKYNVPVHG